MNDRIKQLRLTLGLSQEEFGNRLGMGRGAITNIELKKVEPKPLLVSLICREFGISETWLRTGEGEMFLPMDADEELARVLTEIKLSDGQPIKSIIKSYWSMDDVGKSVIRQLVADLAEAVQEDKTLDAAEKALGN